jgi:magnesium chelatase subunit I
MKKSTTLGALKKTDYIPLSIQQELAKNLRARIQKGQPTFEGLLGYKNTVIPNVERALLSGHSINLLGLRGQAKTRLARQLTQLLDEWVPVVEGSEINDDPLAPISNFAKALIAEKGEDTPITWLHRDDRFFEKLATPDVSVADLIGDVDRGHKRVSSLIRSGARVQVQILQILYKPDAQTVQCPISALTCVDIELP